MKELPIEDQIIRAIGNKLNPEIREICQFTGFKMDVVAPAVDKLISEGKVLDVKEGAKTKFMLRKMN